MLGDAEEMVSIKEALDILSSRHEQFIEANYHLSNPRLILERRHLMKEGISSPIWVEATPAYTQGEWYDQIGLPEEVAAVIKNLQDLDLIFPPYRHQSQAVKEFFVNKKNLVVSTGTGSGKTEVFLYTILGLLAMEAKRARTEKMRSMRAIVLYPMNALVADQLARIRRLFGNEEVASILEKKFGRRIQFGMYTSRTQYHGLYDSARNKLRVKPIVDYFNRLKHENPELYDQLRDRGRIPSKDLEGFASGSSLDERYRTQAVDNELLTRQEMHHPNKYGGTPDILITNYSMLAYMLLRPIEQTFFDSTRHWLSSDKANQLLIVIDEAHLYRGAQGAEVGMLIRRLLQHMHIGDTQVRFILSSASLGSSESAMTAGPSFAADLTACSPESFAAITSSRITFSEMASPELDLLNTISKGEFRFNHEEVESMATALEWPKDVPSDELHLRNYLGAQLQRSPAFRRLYNTITSGPKELNTVAEIVFPGVTKSVAEQATLNLMYLGSQAVRVKDERLLPARIHRFFKGLPKLYVCINPNCSERRATVPSNDLLGRMYTEPKFQCKCGSRVFELLSHRTCGAAYIRAFRKSTDRILDHIFLWDEADGDEFDELHILVESPRSDADLEHPSRASLLDQNPASWLDIRTGHIVRNRPNESTGNFVKVWIPKSPSSTRPGSPWSWPRCPACGISEGRRGGPTYIMDLETKGEEPFANLIRSEFQFQPESKGHEAFPNKGRKILCFSDGRQKAARLARDLQRTVERDSFREMIVSVTGALPAGSSLAHVFPAFVLLTADSNLGFFDDEDAVLDGYQGSRQHLTKTQKQLTEICSDYGISRNEILTDNDAAARLNTHKPAQFEVYLLRLLGDKHFSLRSTLIGYLEPSETVLRHIVEMNPDVHDSVLREIVLEVLQEAAEEGAYDPTIHAEIRRLSRSIFSIPQGWERKGGECLKLDEVIPQPIVNRLVGGLNETQWDRLRRSLIRSGGQGVPSLFSASQGRYAINPDAVTIHIALEETWYRCMGCRQFTPVGIEGSCPACGGVLEEVRPDDLHLEARRTLLCKPCVEVLRHAHKPFTLRSEEHSAQISSKDVSEVFSKSENYELLFQDILIGDNSFEQPIDVLSCTTTMEVGVDIGSLTGVALRTVPPLPSNYQQRAGRAGRRGSALSTIITFADNSPHETYCFYHPETLIGAEPPKPVIYIGNRKIAERHVNATLIQRFFQSAKIPETADVFSSLGSAYSFFKSDGDYSLRRFEKWVNSTILNERDGEAVGIGDLLPEVFRQSAESGSSSWRTDFVRKTSRSLLTRLSELADSKDLSEEDSDSTNLLTTLLEAGILPSFSFPIDICTFTVQDLDRLKNRIVTRYDPSQELRQALSEYIPGRQIVIDKKTFTSYGLHYPFAHDLINRASGQDWDRLDWLNFCTSCESVMEEKGRNLNSEGFKCDVCGSSIQSMPILRPMGFSPEVDSTQRAKEGQKKEPERVYATSAKFPLPVGGRAVYGVASNVNLANGKCYRLSNQELLVVNLGRNDRGFQVCSLCGAIGGTDGLPTPHNRPYPKDPRIPRHQWRDRCSGGPVDLVFGHRFQTDLAILRMAVRRPFNFAFGEKWFKDSCRSLSEALVLSATRTLSIDTGEIAGGARVLRPLPDDPEELEGYVEFFLYDTTSGGAGFASMAFESFESIVSECMSILGECNCAMSCHACLRTYENRIWHNDLDRFLGLSMLRYISGGQLPGVEEERCKHVLERLAQTLELMMPGLKTSIDATIGELVAVSGMKSVKVRITSCMLQNPPSANKVVEISDYESIHQLPLVAHQILARLKAI
jgi:ATP-dependent helicase YprA (DUF1998 family)